MNLRNVDEYDIGLDIGTASVGWAVVDKEGKLCRFNGKPTWGSRLFSGANTAAGTRVQRGLRRRYARRRWRLDLLQAIFDEDIKKVDPEFFIRLRQSRLLKEDREEGHPEYKWPLFNDPDFDEKTYYKKFPTIYHLRKWLMETEEKADLRLIYLALHNIVKHRGNFLQQDAKNLSSNNADVTESVEQLCSALTDWCGEQGMSCDALERVTDIAEILKSDNLGMSDKKERIAPLLAVQPSEAPIDNRAVKQLEKAIAGAIVGASSDMAHIFFYAHDVPADVKTKIYLSKDEDVESFEDNCPDDGLALFETLRRVYSAYVLQGILSLVPNGSLSANKVAEYDEYGKNLRVLKGLVKRYVPEKYDEFFRGSTFEKLYPGEKAKYNTFEAKGYTRYNENHSVLYDDFRKDVEKLFQESDALEDPAYHDMMEALNRQKFLRRLKTSDNGNIPYQLHLEEMDAILENQSRFYPFLETEKRKLDSLVTFRIPYYVGPLTRKNARKVNDREDGKLRFAWAERQNGKENEKVFPWNWDEIIDKDKSAENFILRMTGTCTYIQGEPVLPKSSLLYEEFCVLNELNGAKFTQDGDKFRRFDYRDRADMVDELFKNGSVSYAKVAKWMIERGHAHVHVTGGQGEKGFESRLSSYVFFKKDIFQTDEIPESDYPMIEEIILWNTIFEDRDILKAKIEQKYGNRLDARQIKKICQKRFTGWGKLSEKLLTGIKVPTDNGEFSIMDVLREGDPNNGHGQKSMVLMEALHDDKLQFQKAIDELNNEKYEDMTTLSLDELPGSPALRRGINQALRIVEEIARIVGHAPRNVFVEVTRSDDDRRKGQRTKRRYDALKEQLASLKKESPEFWEARLKEEFASKSHGDLNEKLTLYFMQGGKSLYSGRSLDIDRLSEYEVDHILPQSYIKDDSFENKALVLKEENQRKTDQMLLPQEMRKQMEPYWKALLDAKLIGEKKYRSLIREEVSDKQLKVFINRQIVETSQIVKTVQTLLQISLPETDILPIKAGLSSQLRDAEGFVKCREINDYHHAHDALLACAIGRFIKLRFPDMYDNPLRYQNSIRSYLKKQSENARRGLDPRRSAFIISSFATSGFDKETGEITRDNWNAEKELGELRKAFNYKQCYISRMPEETRGAFWDETIYSPHDPSKGNRLKLPIKGGLDPQKYGGYSSEQFAYFFVYEAEKQGKKIKEFAPVPISLANSLLHKEDALDEYAEKLASTKGMAFCSVVRRRICKYQLLEIDGSRVYLTGQDEVRNGTQIALDCAGTAIAERICKEQEEELCMPVSEDELMKLFERIKYSLQKYSSQFANTIKLGGWDDRFFAVNSNQKKHVILELFAQAAAKKNKIDLTAVGLAKTAGQMKVTFNKIISQKKLVIVDQSVTGMFERRTRIGL